MNQYDLIEEYKIEFAIKNIASIISKKIDEYKMNKSEKTKIELVKLLMDKEKIYENDIKIIKKYLK